MKVMTVLGTRPEIIRLSRIIEKLDRFCRHVLVHTGQNFDANLNDIFFAELDVRAPDYFLGVKGESFGEQIGKIITETERVLLKEKPDRLLILGDTNSGLAAIVAKRMGIPVYHMEAGNRCFEDRVPEEVNRRIIDHSSDVLLPYTERSRANLLREGIAGERIFVTGNPITEVLRHYQSGIDASDILQRLNLSARQFFLVTMHRAENVDDETRLHSLVTALQRLHGEYGWPVVCSLHPRTRHKLDAFSIADEDNGILWHPPFGFADFVRLEKEAFCVLSDSGTVQEECCIFRVANVTIRDVTERPEAVECGSSILSGVEPETILSSVRIATTQNQDWTPPPEYLKAHVSDTVIKIVLGH